MDYEKIKKVVKICHFVGAGLLLFLGIAEFTRIDVFSGDFFLNLYFILFGGLIVFTELGFSFVFEYFYFMKFSFGKCFFAGFIAIITFGSTYWVRLLTAIFFTVACFGFLILGIFYGKKELADEEGGEAKPNAPENKPAAETNKPADLQLPAPQV
eukprot:TRINITY_DN0_c699_g1_i2.p1 TRINITY_DN0_c699_g1~~TRINITY_DN0_c699_g1_i2.p1  ORF type:complete len:167 (+),score=50.80 TRINITY_DN0_c699_g1_i2:37-501(+)